MSISCTKPLSITVTGPVSSTDYLWWKMEETLLNDRVDSIHAQALECGTTRPENITRGTGKINFGLRLIGDSVPTTGTISQLSQAHYSSAIAFDPIKGMTATGWLRFSIYADPIGGAQDIDFVKVLYQNTGNVIQFSLHLQFDTGITTVFAKANATNVILLSVPPATGIWYFFRLWYDPATSKISIQLNMSTTATSAVVPFGADIAGLVQINVTTAGTVGTTADFILDEVSIWNRMLTTTEANYLYNGGAGRTSPIVFP